MPVEAPRRTEIPQEVVPASDLVHVFNENAWALSSITALKDQPQYKDLVARGADGLEELLLAVKSEPSWAVLAVDDITGNDITGINNPDVASQVTTLPDLTKRALDWAEAEDIIEIQDKEELIKAGTILFDTLRHKLVLNPESSVGLATTFFINRNPIGLAREDDERSYYGNQPEDFMLRNDPRIEQRMAVFELGERIGIAWFTDQKHFGEHSQELRVAIIDRTSDSSDEAIKQNVELLGVEVTKLSEEISDVRFYTNDTKPNTGAAVISFIDKIRKYFGDLDEAVTEVYIGAKPKVPSEQTPQ